ncbi:hypothetical protein DFH11DRAFT_1640704 [Phellopilus nigrolimitatus]|nr:hypothetical protein DFH11DRAFT_1640704 [Phellopilus nigrolimitatus]
MNFLRLLAFTAMSVSTVIAQVPPVYYPPDGIYYVYNVQYKRFFNNAYYDTTSGSSIIGWPLTQEHYTNQMFVLSTTDSYTSYSDDRTTTIRVLQLAQQNTTAADSYVQNAGGKIVHSQGPESWTLQPVPDQALQFWITDNNLTITLDNGTTNDANSAQLTAEALNADALDQRWIFVPSDQIDAFNTANDVPLSG